MAGKTIPVIQFNQQAIVNPSTAYREYSCAPTSTCICASAFDLVTTHTFQDYVGRCISAMKTSIPNGTAPVNMMSGANTVFPKFKITTREWSYKKIKQCVDNKKPMIANILTDTNFGYRGKYPHYIAVTGYSGTNMVGISDPHGFNIGRGKRYFIPYEKLIQAVKNNGNRPLYVFEEIK